MNAIDRSEILQKAQNQARDGKDEREVYLDQKSSQLAMKVGFFLCLIIDVGTAVVGFDVDLHSMWMLYWTMSFTVSFYKWYHLRTQIDLVVALVTLAVAILEAALFLLKMIG